MSSPKCGTRSQNEDYGKHILPHPTAWHMSRKMCCLIKKISKTDFIDMVPSELQTRVLPECEISVIGLNNWRFSIFHKEQKYYIYFPLCTVSEKLVLPSLKPSTVWKFYDFRKNK